MRRKISILMTLLLLAGCGGGTDPVDEPAPDFTTVFTEVSGDIASRLAAATSGTSPAPACAELAGAPLDGWIDRLSIGPDAATAALNAYLMQLQLALAKCQDGESAAADVAELETMAEGVRQAAVPSPAATPSATARAAAALAALTSFCQALPAFLGAAPVRAEDGPQFTRRIGQLVQPGKAVTDYRAAAAAIRAAAPCNQAQHDYQQAELNLLGWLAADAACKKAFYLTATTLGDVGLWLACIGPVNNNIVKATRDASQAAQTARQAPCTDGYQAPDLLPTRGMVYAQTTVVAGELKKAYDVVKKLKDLRALVKRGYKLLIERPLELGKAQQLLRDTAVYFGKIKGKAYIKETRDRLSVVTHDGITELPPDTPLKIVISVTQTAPGLEPATSQNSTVVNP
ncbi:hypothetical protein CS0771_64410 [Catellatospora sp. IY07-71]|uniref:hypothetical protein n=1 Tax=Catellatospora sp. IY07-71 TaxID=2728827 RepID=UPI001BB41609|nr:hypothetical protein [Catellatospora sp. IY07-71]BCJ76897.1 hypothetical protein CS0771_64410 [Catellatospora sp. IY07-71]